MTPTNRSIERLTNSGWLVDIVERRVGKITTHDLYGMFDLIAIRGIHTLVVQVTTASNVSARRKKILSNPHLARVERAGWHVEIHGWRPDPKTKGRWIVRVIDDLI